MKIFLTNLAITIISIYALVTFISFCPNPAEWGNGGRGAFAFFSLLISAVVSAIQDSINNK